MQVAKTADFIKELSFPSVKSALKFHRSKPTGIPIQMPMSKELPKITCNEEILEALTPLPDFESRDDVKPWVIEQMEPRGISLVIERSDSSKVVFKCKNIHRKSSCASKLARSSSITSNSSTKSSKAKRIRNMPEDSCPFRLRVSYSVKHKVWAVNIIKYEHSSHLCCNFGDNILPDFSPSTTTPGSTKRSWSSSVYTPISTVSPAFSSPAGGSFTPMSESSGFDYEFMNADHKSQAKKQRASMATMNNGSYFDSPVASFSDMEPFSESVPLLPEDLSDINHLYQSTDDRNMINSNLPLNNFDTNSLDFNLNSFTDNNNDHLNQVFHASSIINEDQFEHDLQQSFENEIHQPPEPTPQFKIPVAPKPKQQNQSRPPLASPAPFKKVAPKSETFIDTQSLLTEPLLMQQFQEPQEPKQQFPKTLDPLNVNLHTVPEEDEEDPFMYLLNMNGGVVNSNYSLEELENLDKAMGFDANDKLLMDMFQGM